MTREELLKQALEEIYHYGNLVIQIATGVGKSKITLDIINNLTKDFHQDYRKVNPKILIVVAEKAHIKNWLDEMKKWDFQYNATIICYASLKNVRATLWDFIIFDEAHHLNTPIRKEIFETLSAVHFIFLSATLKKDFLYYLSSIVSYGVIKCTLDDAFKNNLLREPEIILCPLELDNIVPSEEISIKWGTGTHIVECAYRDRWRYIINKSKFPNTTLKIICTQQQKYEYICDQYDYYRSRFMRNSHNDALKNKWLQWGSRRKSYLGNLKTECVRKFLGRLSDKRYICFCTSIEQANILGKNNAIHSKRKDSLDIINKFNNKEINHILAVGMAKEGVNLTDIEVGIIVQLDGEERAFIQKFGRALRADNPIQYIFYYKNTRDEEYLNNSLEGIDKKYIKEMNHEDIIRLSSL